MQKAIEKIRSEMAAAPTNGYVQYVGGMLVRHLEANPDDANKIMTEGKTVAKSYDYMRAEAQKKKSGNSHFFTPEEGFAIVLKYFGEPEKHAAAPVAKEEKSKPASKKAEEPKPEPTPAATTAEDEFDFLN